MAHKTKRKFTRKSSNQRCIFKDVRDATDGRIEDLASRWLGKTILRSGNLFALNPTRTDRNIGSFCINVRSGIWSDFATGDAGADIISFYAYIFRTSQIEAAKAIADIVGVDYD